MKSIKHFERELNLIQDENLRKATSEFLEHETPNYFWVDGASSSGKYHPKFSQGHGGLVRHTKAVVMFAEELLRMSSYAYMKDIYKDYVIVACILHDTIKYGFSNEIDKKEYENHAENASIAFANFCKFEMGFEVSEFLTGAMKSHMGQWSTNKDDRPFTNIDRAVHMADYMASRNFIDIPQIVEEWEKVEAELPITNIDDEDLPF